MKKIIFKQMNRAKKIFMALANEHTFKCFISLSQIERANVTKLMVHLRWEQSETSRHLAILRRIGLVVAEREGKFIYYQTNKEQFPLFDLFTREIFKGKSASFKERVEHCFQVFRAIAHKDRIEIISIIYANRMNANFVVSRIYRPMKMEQSICGSHLKMLRDAGLVYCEKKGKTKRYFVFEKEINSVIVSTNEYFDSI